MKKSVRLLLIIIGVIILSILVYVLVPDKISVNQYSQQAMVAQAIEHDFRLPADAFLNRIKEPNMIILDIRTPQEYASGHIDGATNIDFYAPDFTQQLEKLDRAAAYSIYCRSGSRSGKALDIMKGLGFTDVADLQGGYSSLLR